MMPDNASKFYGLLTQTSVSRIEMQHVSLEVHQNLVTKT